MSTTPVPPSDFSSLFAAGCAATLAMNLFTDGVSWLPALVFGVGFAIDFWIECFIFEGEQA